MATLESWHGDELELVVNGLEDLVSSLGEDDWCADSGTIDWSTAGHRDWDQTRTVTVHVTEGGSAARVKDELLAAGARLVTESRSAASLEGPYLEVSVECHPPLEAVCRQAAYELLRDAANGSRLAYEEPARQADELIALLGAWFAAGPVGEHATDGWPEDPGLHAVVSTLIADEVAERRGVTRAWSPESRLACRAVGQVAAEYGLPHLARWRSLGGQDAGAQPAGDGRRATLWAPPAPSSPGRGTDHGRLGRS